MGAKNDSIIAKYAINMKTITDIFFDLDHTLWDFDKNSALAFERVFIKHQIEVDLTSFLKAYEPINFAYWKQFREDKITKQELRHGRLIDSFKALNTSFNPSVINTLSDAYIDELPVNNHLLDGAIEILQYLSQNYRLHIITNGFVEVQHLKLNKSNIKQYFKTVTSSEEVGVKKPNPLVFLRALEKANVAAFQSVMIGDTFEADILGAQGVGMHTLFYNYRKELISSDYKHINHLLDIKKLL